MRAIGIAIAIAIVGCTVSRPRDLDTRLWTCESSAECLEGWSCADGNVLSEDYCRPRCDRRDPETCPGGICTRAGACLERCMLLGDSASPCPDAQTCVRTDLLGQEGVCVPAIGCSRSDECPAGTQCFNDALSLPAAIDGVEYASDHLYCVAIPDASNRCPANYLTIETSSEGGERFCLPRCDSTGARCPPDLTCLRELGYLFGHPGSSLCYPGYLGVPCDDDAQCMVGRCLEVAPGRRACTYECEEADRLFGRAGRGCAALEESSRTLRFDALVVACEMTDGGARVCVPRGTAGAPCNLDTLCALGLECRLFEASGGEVVRLCSRDCTSARDCETPGLPATAFCQRRAGGGSCVPRSFEGGSCALPEHCRPGLMCLGGTCQMAL